ncbi:MAG: hypothetical protein P8M25_08365 [Paracoccaceae bacterium]|nr:hypothetical protein [Paracoccaceae bacterium]
MKRFITATIGMAPHYASQTLQRLLHFVFTQDQETHCFGGKALVREMKRGEIRLEVAIIGELTEFLIIDGHKRTFEYTTRFIGLKGHGFAP